MARMKMLQKGWENLNPVVLAAVRYGADSIGVRDLSHVGVGSSRKTRFSTL